MCMTHMPVFFSGAPGDSAGVRERAGGAHAQLSPGPGAPAGLGSRPQAAALEDTRGSDI